MADAPIKIDLTCSAAEEMTIASSASTSGISTTPNASAVLTSTDQHLPMIIVNTAVSDTTSVTSTTCADGTQGNMETGMSSVGSSVTTVQSSTNNAGICTTTTISGASNVVQLQGKRKQKIFLRDDNAPKAPWTGYLRFLNEHREAIRLKNPGMSFPEVSKLLGLMWNELPQDAKKVYLDQAEKDRKQYTIELEKYQKSDAYKMFVVEREKKMKALKQEEKLSPGTHLVCIPCNKMFENKHNRNEHLKSRRHCKMVEEAKKAESAKQIATVETAKSVDRPSNKYLSSVKTNDFPDMSAIAEGDFNVPVFSDAFLNYNKSRESELRKLRKATTEFEEQNAILSKHIDNLKSAIDNLEDEKSQSERDIEGLEPFLRNFCEILARTLSDVRLPNSKVVPNESSVEEFLKELCTIQRQSADDSATIQKVKQVLNDFDYPNCLNNRKC